MNEHRDLNPRILVLQKSPDVSEHYISIMNAIFSAQKKSIPVDACILANEHSSFMQQDSSFMQQDCFSIGQLHLGHVIVLAEDLDIFPQTGQLKEHLLIRATFFTLALL